MGARLAAYLSYRDAPAALRWMRDYQRDLLGRYGWSAEPKVNVVNAAGLPLEQLCDRVLQRMFLPDAEDDVAVLAVRLAT